MRYISSHPNEESSSALQWTLAPVADLRFTYMNGLVSCTTSNISIHFISIKSNTLQNRQNQHLSLTMKFDSRGGVSIFELIIYLPAIVVAAIVCSRHGFGRSSGWIYTLILCLVRIVGSCCQLATYHSYTEGLLEAVVILESIGISPLLLATLGLLSRCADSVGQISSGVFSAIHFRLLQLLIVVGLILCIVGGTSSTSSTGAYQPQTETKVGVVLYVISFIALAAIAGVTAAKLSNAPSQDKRLVWAVLIALPFIFVRLVYSLISVYAKNRHFNLITGSVAIKVVMSVLEEMAVVILYLVIGWKTDSLAAADRGPIASRPWKGSLFGGASGRGGSGGRRRQGPIHALVGAGIAAAQHKKGEKSEMSGP